MKYEEAEVVIERTCKRRSDQYGPPGRNTWGAHGHAEGCTAGLIQYGTGAAVTRPMLALNCSALHAVDHTLTRVSFPHQTQLLAAGLALRHATLASQSA